MFPRRWRVHSALILSIAFICAPGAVSSQAAPATHWQVFLAAPTVRLPRAIAIDPRGPASANKWAYATDSATQRVVKFGTGGRALLSWAYGESPRRGNAASIAVGPTGNVFVANPVDNRVSKFSPGGRLLAQWKGFGGLRAIVVDHSGNVYVAENVPHRIAELSAGGTVLDRWDTRTLWNGSSTGNPTGLAIDSGGTVYISTRCQVGYTGSTCGKRVAYLSGGAALTGDYVVEVLLPLRAGRLLGDGRGFVGLGHSGLGVIHDPCNNRFVMLQSITGSPAGGLYVAGILWPRGQKTPSLAVGEGPGQPGCTHDNIGPGWTRWTLPGTGVVHGLAVDGRGDIFLSQGDRIWKLTAGSSHSVTRGK